MPVRPSSRIYLGLKLTRSEGTLRSNISLQGLRDSPIFFHKSLQLAEQRGVEHDWKEVFTYGEIIGLLSAYILRKKSHLIDGRNIPVVMCEDDQLGKAFDVKAFHRGQVIRLLRTQLIPYVEGADKLGVDEDSSAE